MKIEMNGIKFGEWMTMIHNFEQEDFIKIFGKNLGKHVWCKFHMDQWKIGKLMMELDIGNLDALITHLEEEYNKNK